MSHDANKLINEFIDTHPPFMSKWPLKNRMAIRQFCTDGPLKEFFDEFLQWYSEQIDKDWE